MNSAKLYRTEGMQCTDRWKRKLRGGIEAYVTLWENLNTNKYCFELALKSPEDKPPGEVTLGSIAEEIAFDLLDKYSDERWVDGEAEDKLLAEAEEARMQEAKAAPRFVVVEGGKKGKMKGNRP